MTQVPPVEVSEAWRQSLESWRLNLHGLKAAHCLFVWSGKKPWVVVKRGWHLMYYSSRNEIYNSSIFYHDFFTNRFQRWKTHRCFVLGWILRTLFGIHFLQEVLATFFCRTHGFANSGHKLGSLIVWSHEYSIEREDGDWKCIRGRGHSVTLHRVGTTSHFSSCYNLVEFRQLPCEWCFGRRIQASKQASKQATHPPTHQPTSRQGIIQQLRIPISTKQRSKRMDLLDRCGFMDCLLLIALILRVISRNFWPSWPLLVYVQIWSLSTWRWLPLRLARGLFGDMSDRRWVLGAQIVAVKDMFGTWCNFEVWFLVNNGLIGIAPNMDLLQVLMHLNDHDLVTFGQLPQR